MLCLTRTYHVEENAGSALFAPNTIRSAAALVRAYGLAGLGEDDPLEVVVSSSATSPYTSAEEARIRGIPWEALRTFSVPKTFTLKILSRLLPRLPNSSQPCQMQNNLRFGFPPRSDSKTALVHKVHCPHRGIRGGLQGCAKDLQAPSPEDSS